MCYHSFVIEPFFNLLDHYFSATIYIFFLICETKTRFQKTRNENTILCMPKMHTPNSGII